MELDYLESKRIEWVDIFKALAILTVVIGHSTGRFNIYIYQFHMAAFFFISGYTTEFKRSGFLKNLWMKLCTMILPILTIFFVGIILLSILNMVGIYEIIFQDPFIGFFNGIKEFFSHGNNYVLWMGATWFVIVLFEINVMHKLIYDISGKNYNWVYCIFSIIIFFLGYSCVRNGIIPQVSFFPIDLMMIGQFYFFIGQIFKNYGVFGKVFSSSKINIGFLIITASIMYFCKGETVDYPSRHFDAMFNNVFLAVNGILFIYFVSFYLEKLNKVKEGLAYIGRNTLGILFFHFMFFKIAFAILVILKIVPFSYLKNFIPTTEVGNTYWLLISTVAVVFSIMLWRTVLKSDKCSIMLGQKKVLYNNIYNKALEKNRSMKYFDSYNITIYEKVLNLAKSIKEYSIKNKVIVLCVSIITVLISKPIIMQGIMCNDELQARYYRNTGFINLVKHNFMNEIRMGRPMRAFAALNAALSFVTNQIYIYRGIQIIILIVSIILFGYLLYEIFGSKEFAIFTTVLISIFLPITFEHSVPNAFNGLVVIPMIFLLLSFISYTKYIEKNKKVLLILSMSMFFIAMLGYEFIVTFCILFPVIYISKLPEEKRNIRTFINNSIIPCGLGLIFIIFMLGTQKIVGSSYEGAQIGFVSLKSSFDIIWMLLKTSLPGYYLFNSKYQYLFNIYSGFSVPISKGNIAQIESHGGSIFQKLNLLGSDTISFFVQNTLYMRIILLISLVFIVLVILFNKGKEDKKKIIVMPILVGIAYMILPSLPNSIAKLYQGNITPDNFTGLPVTYFLFMASMFTFCYTLWNFVKIIDKKKITLVISLLICLYCIPVQAMNEVFSNVLNNNYNRLTSIEKLFDTTAVKNMNNQNIYSPDLYQQMNSLYIHDDFWKQYVALKNLHLEISRAKEYSNENFKIYYQNDSYFVLIGGNEIVILSEKRLRGIYPIKISEDQYISCNLENEISDGGFYCYKFIKISDENNNIVLKENSNEPFLNMKSEAGNTLNSARIIEGYYADGWVSKNVEFKIKSGNQGKVILKGYYPGKLNGDQNSEIYINDKKVNDYTITEQKFTIELNSQPNSIVTIKIENNFVLEDKGGDIRTLSFILSDALGI